MKKKILPLLLSILTLITAFYPLVESYGLIDDAVVSSYEWNTSRGRQPSVVRVNESDYYLIAANGQSSDGWLYTIRVWNDNGTIQNQVASSYEYDTSDGAYPSLLHITGTDKYAVFYEDVGSDRVKVITVQVWENGTIRKAVLDTLSFTYDGLDCNMVHVSGNIYAVAYREAGTGGASATYDGFIETCWINSIGDIGSSVNDTVEFDSADCSSPQMTAIDSDTIALAYSTTGNDGMLLTFNISSTGDISNTVTSSWEFDPDNGQYPFLQHIQGDTFAIAYRDVSGDGWIKTTSITSAGMITNSWIDALEFDPSDCAYPYISPIHDTQLYSIAYQGTSADGFINTLNISGTGIIDNSVIDRLEFDTANCMFRPFLLHVAKSYYLIVYEGSGNDGWSKTVAITTNWASPSFSNPFPGNESTGINQQPVCQITITDVNGDNTMTLYWYENSTGGWIQRQVNSSIGNGTHTWNYSQATGNNQKYWWMISCNDGVNNATTVYSFTTQNAPIANNDVVSVAEDSLSNQLNVLSNDIDPENHTLIITTVSDPVHGTASHDGVYAYYSPDMNYNGADSFSYSISDGHGGTASATVFVTVTPVNDPPVVSDIPDQTIAEGTSFVVINLDDYVSDIDNTDAEMTWTFSGNMQLSVSIDGGRVATIMVPDPDWFGSEIITFRAMDPGGLWDEDAAVFTVTNINDPPVAVDDSFVVLEDSSGNQLDVLLNDFDVDSDDLDITGVTSPLHGNVTFTVDFVFYTPDPNYSGPDLFRYNCSDNNGETDSAFVNLTVTPQNDPPYTPSNPSPDNGHTDIDVNANLSWTSGDPDGDPLTYDVYFGTTNPPSKLISNQTGKLYSPTTMNYSTIYYWRIIAWDNEGASASGLIWNFSTEGEYDWECLLTFEEPGGGYDYVYFGEKEAASDDVDIYDVPKNPAGLPPYVHSWFATNFINPYDELWEEYNHYPGDYTLWDLTIQWVPIDYSSSTDITISWNSSDLINNEYNNIFLKNDASEEIINMLEEENYTFNASALTLHRFIIICTNNLQITNLNPKWNIISIPFNQSVSKSNLFVKYNGVDYTWQEAVSNNIILGFIYSWNRSIPQHYELISTLKPGYGYQMYAYYDCELWAKGVSIMNNDGFITNLLQTWNIIGVPNDSPFPKQDLIINYNGVDYNWSEATTNNNPTGGPIILGYIYHWNRTQPQHYELTNIFKQGFGYQMYAFYNCRLFYPTVAPMPLGMENNLQQKSVFIESKYKTERRNIDNIWDVTIKFNEPGGAYDNAIFGEKIDIIDSRVNINLPKNPPGMTPYIRTWFNTELKDPYDELWEEYKQKSNDYNSWHLTVQWVPSDYNSPTTVTISWDMKLVSDSKYTSVILYDYNNGIKIVNMVDVNNYTFTCSALTLKNFYIICSKKTNQPPTIPSDPNPKDGAIEIDINTKLCWTSYDPNPEDIVTYDIYFGATNPPPKLIRNQSATSYNPVELESNKTYYWRVVAWDNHNASTFSQLWRYKTDASQEQEKTSENIIINSNYTSKIFNIKWSTEKC